MHRNIPKPKRSKSTKLINTERTEQVLSRKDAPISFSFRYMQENTDFHINHADPSYFQKLIHRFRDCCKMSKMDLVTNRSDSLRAHPIDWSAKNVSQSSFGLPQEDDLYDEAYQFSVSKGEHGRIHGFFTDESVFNIVWFDKDHKLYPGTK